MKLGRPNFIGRLVRGENREVEGGSAFKLSGSESRCPIMLGGGVDRSDGM